MKEAVRPKIDYDEKNNIISISWYKKGEKHIGWSEELNIGSISIIVDREKKGDVRALEILFWGEGD